MSGHTPGPWSWWTSNSFARLSSDATGKDGGVAWACGGSHAGSIATIVVSNPADASLIAAAPDLLAALEAIVAEETEVAESSYTEYQGRDQPRVWNDDVWARNDPEGFARIVAARTAIAKARGQS